MPTQFIHRLLIITPAARRPAFNSFWAANVDTDGDGGRTFTVPLNATGDPSTPASHFWACTSLTTAQLTSVVKRLAQLASLTPPPDWETFTRNQKRDWLRSQIASIRTATGVRLIVDDNDSIWNDYDAELTRAGLKTITSPL